MQGLHLTADLYQCRCDTSWLTDAPRLGAWCLQAAQAAGLQPVAQLFHAFAPGEVAATIVLAGSHLLVRTWPLQRGVTVDVFVTTGVEDQAAKAQALTEQLVAHFAPVWTERRSLDRGDGE